MAKYIDLDGAELLVGNIKTLISDGDVKSYKSAKFDEATRILSLYKAETTDGAADFTVEIPETDVSGLLEKLTTTNVGNVVITKADGTIEDGGVKLADLATKTEVTAVSDVANANKIAIETLNGDESTDGSVSKKVKNAVDVVDGKIGSLADLDTTAKTDLVVAINEVRAAIDAGGTGSQVTCDTSTTTEGYLKTYTLKQGNTEVCKIDIPKDIFAVSGSVVTNPDAEHTGTFVKLILENQEEPLYIDVASLIENYTAKENATQIQLAVDNTTREISATIVAGSIGTTELTDGAISTVKIADANVTLAKLASDVTTAFDSAGAATAAETNAKTHATNLNTAMDTRVTELESKVGDGFEAISTDEINAMFTS